MRNERGKILDIFERLGFSLSICDRIQVKMFFLKRSLNRFGHYQLKSAFAKFSQNNLNASELNSEPAKFGQPTFYTHSYLIKENEIMPELSRSEFQNRRQSLMDLIVSSSNCPKNLIVIPSATTCYMSDKIPYVFRQNTDFLYFSGCLEPNSCLIMLIDTSSSPKIFKSVLFVPEKNSLSELWDGPRTGHQKAVELFGVHNSLPFSDLENFFSTYLKINQDFVLWYDFMEPIQKKVHDLIEKLLNEKKNRECESLKYHLHKIRVIKSDSEIKLMKKTCKIASEAIRRTIAFSKPGHNEHQLNAIVDYECRMAGAQYLAYPPVIAGGDRANIIHYISNNQIVRENELVLMDAGCEYHGYTSDISRTWPISGVFTDPQKVLYEIVLNAQKELIKKCTPSISLDQLFDYMCHLLADSLQEAHLIPKNLSILEKKKWGYKLCPHHVSHYLGMDVHDTSSIQRNIKLEPGMIVTVEPGLYINTLEISLPKEYRGIGIRIEDDILITNDEPVVLTKDCPKEVDEIESLAKKILD